ncbi:MAG: carbon storage regulator [Oscillospiraceae bacterium]|nr:carbon storage regulator [Oscillospiraceae bacterium]
MLLLSVKEGDYIMIGNIKVKIIDGNGISKIGVEAPKDVPILRQSIYERADPDEAPARAPKPTREYAKG